MIYVNDGHIREIGVDWEQLIHVIDDVVRIKDAGDCVNPLKPYLRFHESMNRIIAMPAFVGGSYQMAGIKWIASFPNNTHIGLPRAHNTIILNRPDTGEPIAFFESRLLNGIRTAAVSGLMLRCYLAQRRLVKLQIGIIGWGPVGRLHLDMCFKIWGDHIDRITLYDIRSIDPNTIPAHVKAITVIADDWRSVYRESNVFITCTVSSERYINEKPQAGALLINVSLRDYIVDYVAQVKAIVVDDWLEVCRENTDIEQLHQSYGLIESDTCTITDVLCHNRLAAYACNEPVYVNPMGLAIFDIGIATFYLREAYLRKKGVMLENAYEF
jgi:2,3-diaminopropionate biosynthesis protein SbnB